MCTHRIVTLSIMSEPNSEILKNIMEGISSLSNALATWAPPNGARTPGPAASESNPRLPVRSQPAQALAQPPNNMRREFQSLFGLGAGVRGGRAASSSPRLPARGRGSSTSSCGRGGAPGGRGRTSGVFYKDVILLDYGAECSPSKLQALQTGRASCMLPLNRQLNEAEIEELVESSFENQLKALPKPRFEYVKVIHHRVVVPHMRSGQMWDGMAIRSLCGQGDLYVRATAPLPVAEEEGTDDGDVPDAIVVSGTDDGDVPDAIVVSDREDEDLPDVGIVSTRDPVTTPRRENVRDIWTPVRRHDASDALISIIKEEDKEEGEEESSMDEERDINLHGELQRLSSVIGEGSTMVSVFRGNVLSGAIRALKRPTFSPRASLDVLFSSGKKGEGAVDMGGPRKEFFRLLIREVLQQPIFDGPANELQLTMNQNALDKYMYKYCGTLLSISIVHGGPGPRSLSPATYRRLAMQGGDICLEEIGNREMRSKISKVLDASSQDEFNTAIDDPVVETLMTLNGLHGPANSFGNKLEVGQSLIKAVQGNRLEPCFSQFREGLSTLGVLASMQAYPNIWFDLFCVMQAPRSSRELLSLFQCELAPEGSNHAQAQARTVAWWGDFVADVEAGDTDHAISVGDILTFVTCLTNEPAGGFDPSPSITFTERKYPEANTCSNILRLPVGHVTYEEFKRKMTEGIIEGQGFGQA